MEKMSRRHHLRRHRRSHHHRIHQERDQMFWFRQPSRTLFLAAVVVEVVQVTGRGQVTSRGRQRKNKNRQAGGVDLARNTLGDMAELVQVPTRKGSLDTVAEQGLFRDGKALLEVADTAAFHRRFHHHLRHQRRSRHQRRRGRNVLVVVVVVVVVVEDATNNYGDRCCICQGQMGFRRMRPFRTQDAAPKYDRGWILSESDCRS
jgi:hypothetical protein